MNCQGDIVAISDNKFKAASILCGAGMFDDAYYMGGYTIELLLKARVCKVLGIDNFFDDGFMKNLRTPQAYRVHDLKQLLILSGLYSEHDKESNDPGFKSHWSIVINWNEVHRYLTGKSEQEVKDFLISTDEIAKWIKKHL